MMIKDFGLVESSVAREHANPGDGATDKVSRYRWRLDESHSCEFALLSKSSLHVDAAYQRQYVSMGRIRRISSNFSWIKFGCLTVSRRNDGTLWVIDGQHRKIACDNRGDIDLVPCLVFSAESIEHEADAFLKMNVDRGPMRTFEKFRAMLISGDETAIAVKNMVESSGYTISGTSAKYTVRCVKVLLSLYKPNGILPKLWNFICLLHAGECISGDIIEALCYIENKLSGTGQSLLNDANVTCLMRAGPTIINRQMRESAAHYAKGGAKIWAEGVLSILNKGRRTNKIPSMFAVSE